MRKIFIPLLAFVILFSCGVTVIHAQQDTSGGPAPISGTIPNPFSKSGGDLMSLFKTIINNIVLPIGGVVAVLAFIYSGFLYVTAQGEPGKIENANNALLYTAIGTAVLLGSWVIAQVLGSTINQLQ